MTNRRNCSPPSSSNRCDKVLPDGYWQRVPTLDDLAQVRGEGAFRYAPVILVLCFPGVRRVSRSRLRPSHPRQEGFAYLFAGDRLATLCVPQMTLDVRRLQQWKKWRRRESNPQHGSPNGLRSNELQNQHHSVLSKSRGSQPPDALELPDDLAMIVETWPILPEVIRAAMVTIIQRVRKAE